MLPPTTTSIAFQDARQLDDVMQPEETVDAPMSAASSSAHEAPPRAKRTRTDEPVGMQAKAAQEAADINAFEAGIPTGIRFLTIQGMRGSGCSTAGESMREFFTNAGVPVVTVTSTHLTLPTQRNE